MGLRSAACGSAEREAFQLVDTELYTELHYRKLYAFLQGEGGGCRRGSDYTVRDEFGHEWTEQMQRPKAFSTDAYKIP